MASIVWCAIDIFCELLLLNNYTDIKNIYDTLNGVIVLAQLWIVYI